MATTNYAFVTPTVGAALNTWGGNLNANTEKLDDLLGGDQPIVGIDINSGAIDGTPVGANTASTGAFTTVTASGGVTGNLTGSVTGNVTGNVTGTASAWQTARTLTLQGDVTGSVSLDGSADVTMTTVGRTNLAIYNLVYPAGCLYETTVAENPGTTFPGTLWDRYGNGRVTAGLDEAQTEFDTLGAELGAKTHTLTVEQIPAHEHTLTAMERVLNNSTNTTGSGQLGVEGTITTASTGGGLGHPILQPYVVVYRWKRRAF